MRPGPSASPSGSPVSLDAGARGLALRLTGDPAVVRLTTTDLPEAPPMVATETSVLDEVAGDPDTVNGASILGGPHADAGHRPGQGAAAGRQQRRPVRPDGRAARVRRPGLERDRSSELLVADGTPDSVLDAVRDEGVTLTDRRTQAEELDLLRSDAFSLGWRVFLLVGVLTLVLAFLGVLALAVVQLRWRSYEVAALRVVGVRRRDLRRAIVTEYVALLGLAVVGGALAAMASLLLVLPSLDIGTIGDFDPAVDFGLRWLVMAGVVGVVMVVVLAIALWISRRTVKQGTPATLRQADAR